MQISQTAAMEAPSLPKGGGSIRGMGETLTAGGSHGLATLSLPLPVSIGRDMAPSLELTYNGAAGNGPFAMGWQCEPVAISLRTSHGVPKYTGKDTFLGPTGEVLIIAIDGQGKPDIRIADELLGTPLKQQYTVTRYQPRIIEGFSRLELWQPQQSGEDKPFWVIYSPDGQRHLLGKHNQSRIANPQDDNQIARWLLEETVTPTGEHIYYYYQAENDENCSEIERQQHPGVSAQHYLAKVSYGNIRPETSFFALNSSQPSDNEWLFHLVLDYGERAPSLYAVPEFMPASGHWTCRPDCFSRYEYGFEIRTRRLCRQVLMFHRLKALAGEDIPNETPALISRLILSYDLSHSCSTLVSVRHVAHENDGTPVTLPPLELDYHRLDTSSLPTWQPMPQLEKFNRLQPYQFVDLYGESLPGILYQDAPGAWWYRPPMRDTDNEEHDAVTYGEIKPLPRIPVQQNNASLMDINGDGKLDWVVTSAGVNGYHTMAPDGQWSPLIPLSALPVEYFHPRSQLADLTGSGLSDLVMIGPHSVRLYANQQIGWQHAENVIQSDGITLPIPGADKRKLVAFADMLGSGQQHLVEIEASIVRCWPNLGYGRFGQPVTLKGFTPSVENFNPDRIYLADMDGAGNTDIIYMYSTYFELYINESGNQFAAPVRIELPQGVMFDNTCQLHIADTQGLGVSSIILTVPHMASKHWRLDLTRNKPWLLSIFNNNMGSETTLFYRSSSQFWLDEKQQAMNKGQTPVSYLPFPVHMLWRSEVLDEITGNRLSSVQDYSHGVWDGREREFRGFARVTQTDTDKFAQGNGSTMPESSPSRTVSWFATGLAKIDESLITEYWQGDAQAYPTFQNQFSCFSADVQRDVEITPSTEEIYWLRRTLKGCLLHSEVYGDDGLPQAVTPYTVTDHRIQVRRIPGLSGYEPSAWVSEIEKRSYRYERIAEDPQCNQQIILASDVWGMPTDSIEIAYPRRPRPSQSPYPDTLPDTLFASSYDDQQQVLRLTRQQQAWHHLKDEEAFILGLLDCSRSDGWEYDTTYVPDNGFTKASFVGSDNLIAEGSSSIFLGHQRIAYTGVEGKRAFPPLITFTEMAELDTQTLKAFDEVFSESKLHTHLISAGYCLVDPPFTSDNDVKVWAAHRDYADYGDITRFYRPLSQQPTLLTGKITVTWDSHYCVVTETRDAEGLRTHAKYDYRFMTPDHIVDANDNHQSATFDALGRLTSSRFWGTENGEFQGYTPPDKKEASFTTPSSIDEALTLSPGIPVLQYIVYESQSWMPTPESMNQNIGSWASLQKRGIITEDGRLCRLAWHRWLQRHSESAHSTGSLSCTPPHILVTTTDRYDNDPAQQLRQTLTFSDGFGRMLQTAIRHEAGDAWQRNENGSLVKNNDEAPAVVHTENRWVVSGRIEYDGKGQSLRTYQPYFLNSWQYVNDDSARQDLYADMHYYDPLGQEYQVKTAKGYLRRSLFTPWFTVSEDENDTIF
ncbi:SpvB/TcaC N-terminal domain-containing protein [Xenorhabdus sp. XENO-7]|uniref:SpvB/TcaC N-terminal domain-containing protein n=1 Tax=Xenorhabdus aichiensis TaxID=3025874 RepID=A0ABT5M2A1_9GAMM|nr:SpvB/TcaC N-terminal domain-containing protein [Xenorhabdus aichiensis]MDC9621815.1 SpvB/TcaC N-terminal domain-containing protein [Xenorhabdus aichiensis]